MLNKALLIMIALQHFGFLVLEMFLWTKPQGMKVFRMSAEQAKATAVLAANQGLYNGFLAVGLVWAVIHSDPMIASQLAVFFAGCVLVAGIYGAYSVNKRIFFIQGLPALIYLVLSLINNVR